jgi:hypothetical protein
MMSSTPTSSNAPATTLLTWGFPRSTTGGFTRSPAFSRQFSTTKSPCVTLFQNNASNGQNNVFSHVSSRIFSPAGTKMSQPELGDKQSSKQATASYAGSPDKDDNNNGTCYNRIFATYKNYDKGIGELIYDVDESGNQCNSKLFTRSQQQKRKHTMNRRKLEAIIHHDDLYHENNNKRRTHSCINTRLKQPPDQSHVTKKHDSPMNTSSVYILIMLDPIRFYKGECLDIHSIEKMAIEYQIHINGILKLLGKLKRHGQFRQAMVSQGQVRLYFPFAVESEQQAIDFLHTAGIVYEKYLFTVVTEDRRSPDYFSFDSNDMTVGPDYFRDLQLFLDQTDYLIERSPAFHRH